MTGTKDKAKTLFGTTEPVAPVRILRAGALTAELDGINLRAIRWHGVEAIRAIQYLVRDENWGTLDFQVDRLDVAEAEDAFSLHVEARCESAGARLAYRAFIKGTSSGELVFDTLVVADKPFQTNRCGFCVLHPIVDVAGAPVRLEHVDGSTGDLRFPEVIDPIQPFSDIRALTHWPVEGIEVRCLMEGDTFEMEDQRNWSDASYKTYVRPLALPWPYTLQAGRPNEQRITLTLSGKPALPVSSHAEEGIVRFRIQEPIGPMPVLAVTVHPQDCAATLRELHLLRACGTKHLIFHFNPAEGHGLDELEAYTELQRAAHLPATLEFVLSCEGPPRDECASLARLIRDSRLSVQSVAISPLPDLKSTPPGSAWPRCPSFEEIYGAIRAALPGMRIGGGMFSYFTELNRKRPPADLIDFITHATAPIVHAADDRSVMESLEALPFITGSVRRIYGDLPYRIGSSTIGMRLNPYGARLNDNPSRKRMTMTAEEPRQEGLFAAAFMVGYASSIAKAHVEMFSPGALTGRFGVVGDTRLRPAFHALRALVALNGKTVHHVASSAPSRMLAIGNSERLVVANLTDRPQTMATDDFARYARLDEHSRDMTTNPDLVDTFDGVPPELTVGAYGIAVLHREKTP
ncbi:hypothetical protein GTW25_12230 [Aliihoeflea aestuarii]|uniref:hypothetical protein n=1 Tax=Aliihoeflea aestuarii TaxID=453840 RepID=UPI0020938387|nr:hypothetical protein [Aliihoeflea aestuarii]MCO6391797.1 hypothetical protein [Aliihoeflea aestuarii]